MYKRQAYVKERKQFGRSISAFQNTQFELAEMKARVEAAKYLVYAAALKKQQAMDGAKVRYSCLLYTSFTYSVAGCSVALRVRLFKN